MKVFSTFRCTSIFLIALLSLQACKSQSSNDADTKGQTMTDSSKTDKLEWLTSLNDAQARSIKEQKPILVIFTSSDNCELCNIFQRKVLTSPTFKSWAENRVVLLEVDLSSQSPLPENTKDQNSAMAKSLKVNTYPACWILRVTHEPENNRFKVKPIGMVGYQETPDEFIGMLGNLIRQ